ncbi:MAG: alpha/beta fold hydrolase [Myxococcota bacterium]
MTTFTTSDGTTLSYELHHPDGTRPPVLLVMGLMFPGRAWRFVLPHLDPARPVAWFDHRGAGSSDAPEHAKVPYSMARMAKDAVELMDQLGWREAHVVGISMGGMVAQHIALEHGARVRSLTLMATHAGGAANRVPSLPGAWHFVRSLLTKGPARYRAMAHLLFPRAFREQIGQAWIEDVLSQDLQPKPRKAGRQGQLRAVLGHDTRHRLGELGRVPTLVVSPGQDLLVRPKTTAALHRGIPGAALLPLPEAGHGLIRQSGETLGRALNEHFARAEAR